MRKSFPHMLGLTVGGLLGLWHAVWALLVAVGSAKPVMDWLYTLHMVKVTYTVLPFNPTNALILVLVTAVFGYVLGRIGGMIWERAHKNK